MNFEEATFVAADDAEVNLGVGRAGVVRVHSPAGNYGACITGSHVLRARSAQMSLLKTS